MATDAEISEAAHEAVAVMVASLDEGAMVTRFVVLAEVIGSDDRAVWMATADGQTTWDSLGLLGYATAIEHANVAAGEAEDEEDF